MNKSIQDLSNRWLKREPDRLSALEHRVLESTIERETISRDARSTYEQRLTVGDRIADAVARLGGSWTFILGFLGFLVVWALANTWLLGRESFDPYPFIFLNLLLSMLAALQAPVIMMSQNRQAQRDRIDAAHDYEVNLKAEIEIMALHEKLDELRHSQMMTINEEIRRLGEKLSKIDAQLTIKRAPR